MSSDNAVELRGVSYTYPGAKEPTLIGVDLAVSQGQCVVVTGPSGCGKTTLTRMINGLVPHVYNGDVSGDVLVQGSNVADWGPDELGMHVGSVFQNPRSQFVNLDVASEIAFGCENLGLEHHEIVQRVEDTARTLEISDLLGCGIEELSGGQKQAVILVSALAMHPDVFVLDEPTASLDVESMKRLARVVHALKAEGKTIIVSEHRLWWLSDVADRVVMMRDGQIVEDWSAQEYAALPQDERAQKGMRAWSVSEMEGAIPQADEGSKGPLKGDTLLHVDKISVSYKRSIDVLQQLSFKAHCGRILGVIGENGAGKTTLLRTLAGLTKEHAGVISVERDSVRFRDRPKTMHLVMQEPGYQLFADSARDELHVDSQRACVLLDSFELTAHADRHPLSLSGGERQRLAIAAGVARGASILILDEPTSGLDNANMRRVAQTLRRLADEGTLVILVTHDYEFLCAACDEIAEVSSGRITAHYPFDRRYALRVRERFGF